uniref:Uncharacterized protein n=2 Tax=Physcomitrium patens TaxID=3218 RepID=A0A7I4DNQ2_PHYPA
MPYLTSVAEGVPMDPSPWRALHSEPADHSVPLMLDMTKHTLGLDKSSDPNLATLIEKTDTTFGTQKARDPNEPITVKDTMATQEMDKSKNYVAFTLMDETKHTLDLGNSRDTNAPSLPEKTEANLGLSGSTSQIGKDMRQTFPAHSGFVPPAKTGLRPVGDYGSAERRMTTIDVPEYNPSVNKHEMPCSWKNIIW